ncbi:Major Facilitator Superfamily protein [Halogranum gelatinilyticum]|uniref:Major Facilitator Superfamily protein n=1 Tax=Halogranum gelatinilyticum TaxID=660521 RepID=A0A1G9ZLS0_9EURY|nr:MFS transporter [Halogranum gelatinilyticum]SDN22422.1 Major Facilitator Superfamily protein [Halogranum gelatinilyticum]
MSTDGTRSDTPAGSPTDERATGLEYWGPAIAVSLAMFIAVIDSTLMNVAIPAIVVDLDTSVSVVQGAIAVYSLVMAALILPGGKLATMVGLRRLMTVTLVVYAAGTLLAAVSWNPLVLYLGWSFVEGAAAAVLLPLTFTVLVLSYEGKDRAKALGILAGVNATGAAVGPILGGALTTYASWRWGFALEALVVLVTLVFVRYLPEARLGETRDRLDVQGALLSAVGATMLVAGFLAGGTYGWLVARRPFVLGGVQLTPFGTSPAVWLIGGGLLGFALFAQHELRVERAGGSPLLPIRILTNGRFSSGILTNMARSLVMAGFIFVIPVFLQSGVGYTAFEAGLAMLPFSLATLVASMVTTGWREHVSPKLLIQGGIVLMAVGLLLLIPQTSLEMTLSQTVVPMVIFGLGLGLVGAQLIDITLSAVDTADSSEASGALNATAMLGYALGTAVIGSFLLNQYYRGVVTALFSVQGADLSVEQRNTLAIQLQSAIETATKETQAAFLARLSPAEQDLVAGAFDTAIVDAGQGSLLLLVLLVLLTLVASALLPREIAEPEPAPTAVERPEDGLRGDTETAGQD